MLKELALEIKSRIDYEEFYGRYLNLKRVGRTHMALCPFHPDRNPSLSVDLERGLWYCFACHEGGDIFTFLMRIESISFIEALKLLASEVGIEFPSTEQKPDIFNTLKELSNAFHSYLLSSPQGLKVVEFLLERGFHDPLTVIERYNLGLCPENLRDITDISTEILRKLGILSSSGHPVFSCRLIFPIADQVGRVRGFGARTLTNSEPKYVNSSASEIFNKSALLYGLNLTRDSLRKFNIAIIVEGYLDAIRLHISGFENVVATMGTALTLEQAKLLRRYVTSAIVMYDGDSAGERATLRAIRILESAGIEPMVVRLPEGLDPDSYILRFGTDEMREMLRSSRPGSEFLASKWQETGFADRQLFLNSEIIPYLLSVRDPLRLAEIVSRLEKFGIPKRELLRKLRSQNVVASQSSQPQDQIDISAEMSFALTMLDNFDEFRENVAPLLELAHFTDPDAKELLEYLLEMVESNREPDIRHFILSRDLNSEAMSYIESAYAKLVNIGATKLDMRYVHAFLIDREIAYIKSKLGQLSPEEQNQALNRLRELYRAREKLIER